MAASGSAEGGAAVYEIRVRGVLDSGCSAWFDGLEVTSDQAAGETRITGVVADQAALFGLLDKVRDLGLPLISVQRIDPEQPR